MAKSGESRRARKLTKSRSVRSFLDESTESATPKTMSVVADVHIAAENPVRQRRQRSDSDGNEEHSDATRRETGRSSVISKASSRASEASRDRSRQRDDLTTVDQSLDLIEECGATGEKLEAKPRRRKQWGTVAEADANKRLPRKRWSKDTGVIQLPEMRDKDASPRRRLPVPAPRSSVRRSAVASFHFDNPAFVSEDEVLRIETDHDRESTRIEMRRMSERSSGSSRRRNGADSDDPRSSRTSLERISDPRTSSVASSEARSATSGRKPRAEVREERLFKKKDSPGDETKTSAETRVRRKKKRRKRKQEEEEEEETKEKETKYVSVTVHRADVLEAVNAKRPMVKVHIVEARTGSYLKNTASNRGRNAYLQPMITGKFDFRENRSMIPVWEEELIFECDFHEIIRREGGDQVLILFEVIDLLSFAEASLSYDRVGSEGCWKKIAWAFLKPIGTNKVLHVDKKVRLQLYRPKRNFKRHGKHKCEVYTWWQSNNRDKYPSSLLVTVTSVAPKHEPPVLQRQLPLQHELLLGADSTRTSDSIGLPKWARLAAQSCKIPNERMFETAASENGCFYVAFSNDGKYLACVHSEEYNYPIVVYEVKSGKIHVRFLGHETFVYSLSWSSDDRHLLSASADHTARIWDIRDQIVQHVEMLPHPSYVYCATYAPGKATIVATGCYDRVARIWTTSDRKSQRRELSQELEGHEGFVNSAVFQRNGNLITADSVGSIILWTAGRGNGRMREWRSTREIKVRGLEGVVINTIALHPLESRLLVHSRDNGLRMLDLATGVVLQKYRQLRNQRIQVKACISPCGGLILCGGEDSALNIWNLESGRYVARYDSGRSSARVVVTCVDYHPYDHVLAFSTLGSPSPVRVLRFNKNASGSDVGLSLAEDAMSQASRRGDPRDEVIPNAPTGQPAPCSQRSESSGKAASCGKAVSPSSNRSIDDGDYQRPSTAKLRPRLREMERGWKERGQDRLYRIIQKIDSLLSKKSMFPENVESDASSGVADRDTSVEIESAGRHRDDLAQYDRSSLATRSRSQDRSSDFRGLAALFATAAPSCRSSPDSAGTYVIEMPDFENNIVAGSEEVETAPAYGSDGSRVSNATFVIENECT